MGPVLDGFLRAVDAVVFRWAQRATGLTDYELDPNFANELLPDWNRFLGLPGPCYPPAESVDEERARMVAQLRLATQGGQSIEWFKTMASLYGYTIEITEFIPERLGSMRMGDTLGDRYAFAFRVDAAGFTVRRFKMGQSAMGDPLATWPNDPLPCLLEQIRPAHTRMLVVFGDPDGPMPEGPVGEDNRWSLQ